MVFTQFFIYSLNIDTGEFSYLKDSVIEVYGQGLVSSSSVSQNCSVKIIMGHSYTSKFSWDGSCIQVQLVVTFLTDYYYCGLTVICIVLQIEDIQ